MKKEYKLTEKQIELLLDASKPVPYMIIGGVAPTSPQERANNAWEKIGEELGFDYMTARPVGGKGMEYFIAEESNPEQVKE